MKKLILLLVFLCILPVAQAATLSGQVYDLDLDLVNSAIIEINSTPLQKLVSTNGEYSFELNPGVYLLTATAENQYSEEKITIQEQGNFNLDFILFPDTREQEEILNDPLDQEDLSLTERISLWWLLLLLIIPLVFLFKKKKVKEEDPLKIKVYEIIKKEKRISQKDLRKKFAYSEAKISLIISELESENKIKKIKKGRTNIITLI